MLNSNRLSSNFWGSSALGATVFLSSLATFTGCGPAQSVYHDGNFSAEQKAAAQAEYQTVEDEESQGSNKKKKPAAKR